MDILKRSISILLATVMVFTMLPLNVRAAETEVIPPEAETVAVETTAAVEIMEKTLEAAIPAVQGDGWGNWSDYVILDSVTTYAVPGGNLYFGQESYMEAWEKSQYIHLLSADSGITRAEIPNEVQGLTVDTVALSHRPKLTYVKLPCGLRSLSDSAFQGCTALEQFEVDSGSMNYYAEDGVLFHCYDTTIFEIVKYPSAKQQEIYVIPEGTTTISSFAFENTALKEVYIPDSVTYIDTHAFSGNSGLKEIHYAGNISQWYRINGYKHCELSGVSISWNATPPTAGNTSTASGTFGDNISWTLEDGLLTIRGSGWMDAYPEEPSWKRYAEEVTKLVIEEGVTSIYQEAFTNFSNLTTVKLPESMTSIHYFSFGNCSKLSTIFIPKNVQYIDLYVFLGCDSLDGIWVDENNQYYCSDELGVLYFKDKSKLTAAPGSLSGSYVVPDSVTCLLDAFARCGKLEKITLPKSINFLLDYTFAECIGLKEVDFPASITKIGPGVFAGCTSLSDIYYSGSPEQWAAISVGADNEALKKAKIHYNSTGSQEEESPNWQKAYYDFIVEDRRSSGWESEYYELIYLDNDEIPEIWIYYNPTGQYGKLITYQNGSVIQAETGRWEVTYAQSNHYFHFSGGSFGTGGCWDKVYALDNGQIKEIASGLYTSSDGNGIYCSYTWNNQPVSEQQYHSNIQQYFDPEITKKTYSNSGESYDYDGILKYLGQESNEGPEVAAYETVLNEYREICMMTSEEFSKQYNEVNYPYVNWWMMNYYHIFGDMQIVYALYDIDSNGVKELLVGRGGEESAVIIGLYAFDGKKAVTLNNSAGERTSVEIYKDGTVMIGGSGGAAVHGETYYRFDKPGYRLSVEKDYLYDGNTYPNATPYYQTEEYKNYKSQLTEVTKFDWTLLNFVPTGFHFVLEPSIKTLTVKTGQLLDITVYLYNGKEVVTDMKQPDLALGHIGNEKIARYIGWKAIGDGGFILTLKGESTGVENLTIHDVASDTKLDFSVTVTQAEVNEYLDNSEIKINESGSAFAYYISDPYQDFLITINGNAQSVRSNEKGVFRVPLGAYYINGTENVTVEVTHIGGEELSEPLKFYSTITITPLEFSQNWEASMDANVGVKFQLGMEDDLLKLKASLAEAEAKIGGGTAMNISRSYSAERENLEITSDKKVEAGLTGKCGITGSFLRAKYESGFSAGVKGSDTISYGLKIADYSPNNSAQQRAVATFLLGEAMFASPGNAFIKSFYDHMAKTVYQNIGGIIVHGSASKFSGSLGTELGKVTVNDVEIATALEAEVGTTFVQAEKSASDGSQEKSMSLNLDLNLSAVTPAKRVEGSEIGYNASILGLDFLGRDIKIAAKQSANGANKTLETSSLSAASVEMKLIEIGIPSTAVYNKYIFKDEAMNGLLSNTQSFDDYINKDRYVLSILDICELADVISTSEAPIVYEREANEKVAFSIPLEFGLGLGLKTKFGVTLSYLEDTSYTSATGYAVDDAIFLTSEAVDIKGQVNANKRDLSEVFTSCIQSLANDAANFFKEIGNAIQEGVEDIWAWIDGKANSVHNWAVSLTSASSEEVWADSMAIDVFAQASVFSMRNTGAAGTAMTIGRPFIVTVTDNVTGEEVKNFQQEPLTFTIRYAGEDLMAANYDARTQVIAMYRYSDNGDYFEYIGGVHDPDAMTVTATITKPGQYILAAEVRSEEPPQEIVLGDVNSDGWVDSYDAALVLKYDVMLIGDDDLTLAAADVSGDGFVDSYDASLILKFDVMLIDKFPAEA